MKATLYAWVYRLHYDRRGQDLVEYALMAGFVAVAGGAIFPSTLMPGISSIFSKINTYTAAAASQGS
jgi:Flp pilus assembly pilin Flp